jgi:hypothetical protein
MSSPSENPGSTIFNVPHWLRARLSWLSICLCSIWTFVSFGVPKKVVGSNEDFKSNVKSGSTESVNVGAGEESGGGVMTTYKG